MGEEDMDHLLDFNNTLHKETENEEKNKGGTVRFIDKRLTIDSDGPRNRAVYFGSGEERRVSFSPSPVDVYTPAPESSSRNRIISVTDDPDEFDEPNPPVPPFGVGHTQV